MADIKEVLEQRGNRYGEFLNQARISQAFKDTFHSGYTNYTNLSVDKREAIEMILHKIARILNGDPNYKDSWVDIAGYATLVAETLKDEK